MSWLWRLAGIRFERHIPPKTHIRLVAEVVMDAREARPGEALRMLEEFGQVRKLRCEDYDPPPEGEIETAVRETKG